jgi:4-amino-4-deoxy-L-arabinose transferase-like glycosyltransferase
METKVGIGARWALALIALLLAWALRLHNAENVPLWTDEGWSAWAARGDTLSIVADDRHPPLYFLALSAWREVGGESRLSLRFLSLAAGLLTVAAAHRLGADVFGRRAALWAALALAALPVAVLYSQEVRHYGWLTLFAALSWLCLLRLLRRPGRGRLLAYALTTAALLYAQYFGAFVVIGQAITVLAGGRARWRWIVGAWLLAALLYLPWLWVVMERQWSYLLVGIGANFTTLRLPADLGRTLDLLVGAPFVIGAALVALAFRQRRWGRALWLGAVGAVGVMLLLGLALDYLGARLLVMLTPPLMILAGAGLARLRRAGWIVGLAWLALLVWGALRSDLQPRLPLDAAAAALAASFQPGDAVILELGWDDNAAAYEVGRVLPAGTPIVRMLAYMPRRPDDPPASFPPAFELIAPYQRVWVVQWLQAPHVLSYLETSADFALAHAADVDASAYGAQFGAPTIRVRLYARR